jgi:hypothetical protein
VDSGYLSVSLIKLDRRFYSDEERWCLQVQPVENGGISRTILSRDFRLFADAKAFAAAEYGVDRWGHPVFEEGRRKIKVLIKCEYIATVRHGKPYKDAGLEP